VASPGATDASIRPISHQSTNDKVFEIVRPLLGAGKRLLDLGAGEGYFSQVVGEHVRTTHGTEPSAVVHACDVTPSIFRYAPVTCAALGNDGRLPYPDTTFDIVCSLEVIEHVEDHFAFCREIARVLKPGGTVVISTPNVLNLNSRWRYLVTGFATLFNPLSLSGTDVVHTSGHIHPVSYYYLAFALHRAGVRNVAVAYDRTKRSAVALWVLTWPLLTIGDWLFRRKLRRKQPAVLAENDQMLRDLRSRGMLVSRSIIVVGARSA
jgi:ubiquinone/menaquinone biosynthesis C-methylase UbiE